MPIDDGRVEIIALAGLPEVAPGDDLEAMIGDALEATPGVLPLQAGDVLVVTQKIVSKAEGAVVDLRTITPSAEAIEWGRAWDRDPRQIQVVLDEAVRRYGPSFAAVLGSSRVWRNGEPADRADDVEPFDHAIPGWTAEQHHAALERRGALGNPSE